MSDRTLIILKPDTLERKIMSKVIKRLEATGLSLCGAKLMSLTKEQLLALYKNKQWEEYFPALLEFMTSGPSLVMCWEGEEAAGRMRAIIGSKQPKYSNPGTIRGDLATTYPENLIHGSDPWDAGWEIPLFFEEGELI